jgi:transposase-like protein
MAYPSYEGPIVAPPHAGHRRRFDEADKRRILQEADQPGASLSQIARRYGIARRILCRWRQDLSGPVSFATVQLTDYPPSTAHGEEPVR